MYNKQLLTFITVADSGSFAKASKKLYISTVSVMKQINALESSMGFQLLRRTNQGVSLTSAGQSIYDDAKEMIRLSQKSISRAKEIASAEKKVIRIGSSNLRSFNVMMDNWSAIDDESLSFQIKIIPFSDDSIDITSALDLLGKEFDCFVSPCDLKQWKDQYNILLLKSLQYCLALPRKHPQAQNSRVSLDQLKGETLMLLRRGLFSAVDALRSDIEKNYPEITIKDIPRSYNTEIFNECVKQKYLMGIPGNWSDVHPSLTTRPVDWNCSIDYGIIYEKEPSPLMQQFISAIKKTLPQQDSEEQL